MDDIRSLQHPLVKHLSKLRGNGRYRASEGRVVLVGEQLLRELKDVLTIHTLLFLPGTEVTLSAERIFKTTPPILQKIVGHATRERMLGEVPLPPPRELVGERLLVLEAIQDPGNVGTLIRSAAGLGFDGAFFLGPCADPFNDKALRAGRGAVFRLPYQRGSLEELAQLIQVGKYDPYIGDVRGETLASTPAGKRLLALGNEAQGPSHGLLQLCKPVRIPLANRIESLNVAAAGAILMYLLRGQGAGPVSVGDQKRL